MGNKINPNFYRININKNWISRWYSKKQYIIFLKKEIIIRKLIEKHINKDIIIKNYIEIFYKYTIITLFTIEKKLIIEKQKKNIKNLKIDLKKNKINNFFINIKEVSNIQKLIKKFINNIKNKILNNINYKKDIIEIIKVTRNNIKGIKIIVSGRIKGSDIAKKEKYGNCRIKNNKIKYKIEFYKDIIKTKYGIIGIKIWINYD